MAWGWKGDGAKWGVSDLYDGFAEELGRALAAGADFDTGWWGVKKEIQSGRIRRAGSVLYVEASCSDDFDTEATGQVQIEAAGATVESIKDALDRALDEALAAQRDNTPVAMYVVGRDNGTASPWGLTYLRDVSGHGFAQPPGDYYHRWGWQEVEEGDETPAEIAGVAARIEASIYAGEVDDAGTDGCVVEGWRVRLVR